MTFGRNPYENEPSDRAYDAAWAEYDEYVAECEGKPLDFDEWYDRYVEDDARAAAEARAEDILAAREYYD
jgi:hypothetical protein